MGIFGIVYKKIQPAGRSAQWQGGLFPAALQRFPTAREDEKIAPVTNVPGRSSISDLKEGGANSGGIFEIRP
jgi:hypothetical protein